MAGWLYTWCQSGRYILRRNRMDSNPQGCSACRTSPVGSAQDTQPLEIHNIVMRWLIIRKLCHNSYEFEARQQYFKHPARFYSVPSLELANHEMTSITDSFKNQFVFIGRSLLGDVINNIKTNHRRNLSIVRVGNLHGQSNVSYMRSSTLLTYWWSQKNPWRNSETKIGKVTHFCIWARILSPVSWIWSAHSAPTFWPRMYPWPGWRPSDTAIRLPRWSWRHRP